MVRRTTAKGRFGTLAGVFTPTILTILGLILFLRVGWVVGQAGLVGSLAVILAANAISFVTGLSLSSVATNMFVRTGGTYYMISRTLGLEIGGAIGIPLFLSQAVSVAFYVIGFTEAFVAMVPGLDPQLVASGLALVFGYLAWVGAGFVLRLQYLVLAVLVLALVGLLAGGGDMVDAPALFATDASTAGYFEVFAIYFPAVTGIMVGVSMSGDLENPGRAIPLGTLSAVVVSTLVYMGVAVWLALHAEQELLIRDNMVLHTLARWPVLILAGVWASTLSSALGSVLAAPRTLQALARDRVVPRPAGRNLGSPTEPRAAVLVTTAIAVGVIWMGNLDFVAPVITMFFLNTYGMINLTAGLERLVGNPSFRPQFKVPWPISLAGAAACYWAMFLVSPGATVIAVVASYGVFFLLSRRVLRQSFGDIRSGLWYAVARFGLIRLEQMPWHARNWRPNIVVFIGLPEERPDLAELGAWLSRGQGIVTFSHLLEGDPDALAGKGHRMTARRQMRRDIRALGAQAFAECALVTDFHQGAFGIMQTHGLAGLEPNTMLMGLSRDSGQRVAQLNLVRRLLDLGKSSMLFCPNPERGYGKRRRIDVWWRGRDRNAELMLMLAHIVRRAPQWAGAHIRVLRIVTSEEARQGALDHIAGLLANVRVDADPVVLVRPNEEADFSAILAEVGAETDLCFLGLAQPDEKDLITLAEKLPETLAGAPSAVLVRSGENVDILDSEFELPQPRD